MADIVVIGYGGHAKSVIDSILRERKHTIIGYTDLIDYKCSLNYLGTDDSLKNIYDQGIHSAVLGIGYMGNSFVRDSIVNKLIKIGYKILTVIDPSAVVSDNTVIGDGVYIGKNVIVNTETRIGDYSIINSGAIVEHENQIGDFSHIAVGAVLCGNVIIGHHSLVGANATVIQGKSIGNNCIIGANSTVLTDVDNDMKVYGVIKAGSREIQ